MEKASLETMKKMNQDLKLVKIYTNYQENHFQYNSYIERKKEKKEKVMSL